MKLTMITLLLTAVLGLAQETKPALEDQKPALKEAPAEMTGLAVGQKAPEFTLKSQDGTDRELSDFLKKGPVALVFYRSADW